MRNERVYRVSRPTGSPNMYATGGPPAPVTSRAAGCWEVPRAGGGAKKSAAPPGKSFRYRRLGCYNRYYDRRGAGAPREEMKPGGMAAMKRGLRLLIGSLLVGLCAHGASVPVDDVWKILKGTAQPPAEWRDADFDDSTWLEDEAPVGYGYPTIVTTLSDMRWNYSAVYFRIPFELEDTYAVERLVMTIDWDDGFVAYLNGQYVLHRNMPISIDPPYVVLASPPHAAGVPETIVLDAFIPALRTGANVLAVQVHNASKSDEKFFFRAKLDITTRIEPFACVTSPVCADKGDGNVLVGWTRVLGTALDAIQIREGDEVLVEVPGNALTALVTGAAAGNHSYRLFGLRSGFDEACYGGTCEVTVSAVKNFTRGDANIDNRLTIADPIFLARYLFQQGSEPSCLDASDIDDNGKLDLADVIVLLQFLFNNGAHPPAPGPYACGADTVLDELPICNYPFCP